MPSTNGDTPGTEIRLAADSDVRFPPSLGDKAQMCIQAAELRAEHMTFTDIARKLHLASPAVAKRAVQQGLTLIPSEDVREVRRLSDQRLDRIARGLLEVIEDPGPLVSQGKVMADENGVPYPDRMVQVRAYEALLKVNAEHKKTHGANAPVKSITITADMITARIAELKAELGIRGSGPALEGFVEGEGETGQEMG